MGLFESGLCEVKWTELCRVCDCGPRWRAAYLDGLLNRRTLCCVENFEENRTADSLLLVCQMITRFSVQNYKCLAEVDIPLTPIHVVIGQNDSGKTSLLEAMLALSQSSEKQLAQAFSGDWKGRELVFEGSERPEVQFDVNVDDARGANRPVLIYHLKVDFPGIRRECRRIGESVENGHQSMLGTDLHPFTGLGNRSNLPPGEKHDLLDAIAESIGSASLYRFDPKLMAIPAAIDPARKFRMDPDGFGLATLLDDILGYDANRFLALRSDFCEFFPQFRGVRIETEEAWQRHFDATGGHRTSIGNGKGILFETTRGGTIRAQQASDGAILFLGLLALIHSPQPPKLLLIEEPENGVYPKRLEQVIGLIRRLQESPLGRAVPQIVMTTHSPYLLSLFSPDEVTLMTRQRETGLVQARPLRDAPHIRERLGNGEFHLGELWYNLSEDELFADA